MELPSIVFREGLKKYPPSPVLPIVGGSLFIEWNGQTHVTPFGALAAGLGWRHTDNRHGAIADISDFLEAWEIPFCFDFLSEFQKRARWNGRAYPFAEVEAWLIELEEIAGRRDTNE